MSVSHDNEGSIGEAAKGSPRRIDDFIEILNHQASSRCGRDPDEILAAAVEIMTVSSGIESSDAPVDLSPNLPSQNKATEAFGTTQGIPQAFVKVFDANAPQKHRE